MVNLSKANSKKLELMREDPALFKKFQDAVNRAKYLYATVNLCDDCAELCLFKLDRTGVGPVIRYKSYDEEDLNCLNQQLDNRAKVMRDKWLPEYRRIDTVNAAGSSFSLDLTHSDYAIIEVGDRITELRIYHMRWDFNDLIRTAQFISDFLNPSSEVVDRYLSEG